MNATAVAVVLCLFSALAYAAAAVAQERLASRSSGAGVLRLLRRGAWWGSVLLNGAGALLHVVSLRYGPLTVVQPLGALTLVAAVPLGARVAGRRVTRGEWRGTAYTLAGLAAILAAASGPAPESGLSVSQALAVAGTTIALIGLLARPGARPGLRHGAASGIASGVASALTQTVTVAIADHTGETSGLQITMVALLVAAFAAAGLLLSQTAYRGGLGAPLAMVTLSNPVAAAAIGLTLLGERLQGGLAGILLASAGAGLASWGVVLLSKAGFEVAEVRVAAAVEMSNADGSAGVPQTATESYDDVERAGAGAAGVLLAGAAEAGTAGTAQVLLADEVGVPVTGVPVTGVPVAEAPEPYDADHPVAVVLALPPESASPEPALLPRPAAGPEQLTSL